MINLLDKGSTGSIIGILGIVIGVVISCIFYLRSKVGARPVYQFSALRIIGNISLGLPNEFKITYGERSITRLIKTQCVFWNSGMNLINGNEVVKDDPIRLVFNEGTEVLNVSVISHSRKVNKFVAEIDEDAPNSVKCDFDFLDPQDGVIFEILHTDYTLYPKVLGTIKGVPKGIINKGIIEYPIKKRISKRHYLITITTNLIYFLFLAGFVYFLSYKDNQGHLVLRLDKVVSVIVGIILGLSSLSPLSFILKRKKFPKVLIKEYKG